MTFNQAYGSYHFGSSYLLTKPQLQRLIDLFHHQSQKHTHPLGGRGAVSIHRLDGIGPVVIKYYTRGGFMHHFVKRRYFKVGKNRGQLEYELLQKVRNLGINTPEPIAFAYRGRLFYLAWLVTREIKQPISLTQLSFRNEKSTRKAMDSALNQISLLIQNNILHIDLHPGNVVVDNKGKVFLLDFDKGRIYNGKRKKLIHRYFARWERAVIKHGLPEMLIKMMQVGLKSHSDE